MGFRVHEVLNNWISIIIIGIQPLGRSVQRPELSQATGMALVRCILGKFLGVACHCFPPILDVPTFHHQVPPRPLRRERFQRPKWELWTRILSGNFAEMTTSTPFRVLLHAANLRHGTDGFTSPTGRIMSPKNSNDTIRNRTRDLPGCSVVP